MKTILQQGGAAFAALLAAAVTLQAHAASGSLPPERQAGSASFVSGGVGEGEARRFEPAFDRYPLVVQLFQHGGPRDEYTADARVKITDPKGHVVLDQKSDGPFMLVHLPAGDYRIGASLNGRRLAERTVHVTERGHAKATFVFPSDAG